MKFLILFLAVLPLAWCGKPITACKCARVDCPSVNEAERCLCENQAAIACANLCGTVAQVKPCPMDPLIRIIPTPSTTSSTTFLNTSSATPVPEPQKCGTFVSAPCPLDQSCVNDPANPGCDIRDDCDGICVSPQRCGSRGLQACVPERVCVNDPNDPGCSTAADCPGYCVLLDGNDCSPELGIGCPSPQQVCVDDPSGDCIPGGNNICLEGKCAFLNGRSSAVFLEE